MHSNTKKTKTTITLLLTLSLILLAFQVPLVNATEDSWTPKASMQEARAGLGVAVVNGKIYAIGGFTKSNSGQYLSTNEEYNPATDTWSFKASIPTPRNDFGITVYQNKIYCIGGRTNESVTGVNEVYDPASNTWAIKASMPTARRGVEANVVGNKIYLVGGASNANEEYDPATDTWTTKTSMPVTPYLYSGWSCTSVIVDDKIHVIGLGVGVAFHQIYDPNTDSWSSAALWPSGATFGVAGVTTGIMAPKRIYVFGVDNLWWDLSLPNFRNLVYNPENDSWTFGTSMPTERIQVGVAVVNDTLYVIGGFTLMIGNNVFTSAVNEQYTPIDYIPEFPSWIIMPLLIVGTLVIMICKQSSAKGITRL